MAQRETWRFTVSDRQGAVLQTVEVQAKRQADVLKALRQLKAPGRTIVAAEKGAAGQIRRFNWETPLLKVVGVRI
jgi:hypothetical protein